MDEIEQLVIETYAHFNQNYHALEESEVEEDEVQEIQEGESEFPNGPGILYHIQKSSSIFVIRTFVSKNIQEDYFRILSTPEEFPSLRLLEGGMDGFEKRLRFFVMENPDQAEIVHDQLNNRRFPMDEEMMCNLSDPGFSWWLTSKDKGFQLSFTMSVGSGKETVKLGPLGDQQLALKNFQVLESIITDAGLALQMQNEVSRVQFLDGEDFLMEELKDLFQYGVVSPTMEDLFRVLARSPKDHSTLEMTWFYLQELAAMRRFWIQVQYDLNAV